MFFDAPLPNSETLADALTFHAFEIESVENDILDVKVTPNRGHDCLCHRGIAQEVSAILNLPMKYDPLRAPAELLPVTDAVSIDIQEPALCARYIAGYVRNVKVAPSPEWLRKRLEEIGQRSINNVVDATNFVMFNLGQPLHAFDASKLSDRGLTSRTEGIEVKPRYAIAVRKAKEGERVVALDGKDYTLADTMLVIADGHTDLPIGIAGVKGGAPAAITEETEHIVIESANFDGVSVRKTAQALKLRTDASQRFEQVISPELAAYGMKAVVELILHLAGGEFVGFVDDYEKKAAIRSVSVTLPKINRVLGTKLHEKDAEGAFERLGFAYENAGETYTIFVPFERLDLRIPEDLVEEVARIVGYERVPATELSPFTRRPDVNANFNSAEHAREALVAKGYSEVFTSVFAEKGDRVVANKVDGVRPYLRRTLVDNLKDAYERNSRVKDLLGLKGIRLFEIGTVWQKGNEVTMLGIADEKGVREEALPVIAANEYAPFPTSAAARYQPFSKYPFIVRDISMWVPDTDDARGEVIRIFGTHGGDLLRHVVLFDQFKRDGKNSLGFRLVFQSFDRTLTDFEANERMESITNTIKERGWEVR